MAENSDLKRADRSQIGLGMVTSLTLIKFSHQAWSGLIFFCGVLMFSQRKTPEK
jgi:hypothetical protein